MIKQRRNTDFFCISDFPVATIVRELSVHPWQVFFDDSARNIAAGKAAGFHTVVVSFLSLQFCSALQMEHQYLPNSRRLMNAVCADGTMQVGSSSLVPGADVALESIHNIREALPELWVEADGEHVGAVLRAAAVETTVLA